MAKKKSYQPVPKSPYPSFNPSANSASVSSTVKNSTNTGQSSTSIQKTGSTGAMTNTVNVTSTQGKPGKSGTATVTRATSPSTASTAPSTATIPSSATRTTPRPRGPMTDGTGASPGIPAEVQANATIAAARSKANSDATAALSGVGSRLASERVAVIERLKAAGISDDQIARVNDAFDRADSTVNDQKRKRA